MHDTRDDRRDADSHRDRSRSRAKFLLMAVAWAVLQQPRGSEVSKSPVSTPNPEKAPFISRTLENMTFVHPRLANAAGYWEPVLAVGSVVWGLAAAAFFAAKTGPRSIGTPEMFGITAASTFVGLVLAWPWIAAIALDFLRTVNRR